MPKPKPEVILETEEETAGETGGALDLKRIAILAGAAMVGAWIVFRRKNEQTTEKPGADTGKPAEGRIKSTGWESFPLKPV